MFSFPFTDPQTKCSLYQEQNVEFLTLSVIIRQCREHVVYDIRAASSEKGNNSSSGQHVEMVEGNEVRKGLMLLGV